MSATEYLCFDNSGSRKSDYLRSSYKLLLECWEKELVLNARFGEMCEVVTRHGQTPVLIRILDNMHSKYKESQSNRRWAEALYQEMEQWWRAEEAEWRREVHYGVYQ